MRIPFLVEVFIQEARQRHFIIKSLFFSFLYFVLVVFLFNFKSYQSIWHQTFDFLLKLQIYMKLFISSFEILGIFEIIMIFIASIFFGLNLELVLRKLKFLKNQGSLHLTLGAGLVSLFAAGCAGCGLSIASVFGIAGAIALLPYGGSELFLIAIIILLVSLWYNLQALVKACNIKKGR